MRIETLKRRSQFLRVRGGARCALAAFVLEGRRRPSDGECKAARVGFTVTKKMGNAVVRNRIRRRLKAALAETLMKSADATFDYVVIARDAALSRPFPDLCLDFETALARVNSKPQGGGSKERRTKGSSRM